MNRRLPVFLLTILLVASNLCVKAQAENEQNYYSLAESSYYDKTLAGLLGHIAGFLSGYEFVNQGGSPASPLPDSWFSAVNGPYSGNYTYAGDPNYPGYDRLFENGVVGTDDDYHIDFFNQHILAKHGPNVSYFDIKEEWKEHYIHDWGSGGKSAYLTRCLNMQPPFTGQAEFGNEFYWCTESYIENDTLGMDAPCMPNKTIDLVEKFASVTGDFDSVIWAKYEAAMYSLAYSEQDAYSVVTKASAAIPDGTWPKQIYQECLSLYSSEENWRDAVSYMASIKRNIYYCNNVQALSDINNAIIIISLLYGENDYLETMKIASLSGYDGDCNAATATGIMGVLKGMSGTPSSIKNAIYPNNTLRYINDIQSSFPPYIRLNYPREQSIQDIVELYQQNAEAIIIDEGGCIQNGIYYIPVQSVNSPEIITVSNYDFESSGGWNFSENSQIIDYGNLAHSGRCCGRIIGTGVLSQVISGLNAGDTYRFTCFVKTGNNSIGLVKIDDSTNHQIVSVRDASECWVKRELMLTASAATATISFSTGGTQNEVLYVDNINIEKINDHASSITEAESSVYQNFTLAEDTGSSNNYYLQGSSSSRGSLSFTCSASITGEYILEIHYTNECSYLSVYDLYINNSLNQSVFFPKTATGSFLCNDCIRVPIELTSGTNTISLSGAMNYCDFDYFSFYYSDDASIESAAAETYLSSNDYNYLLNGDFSDSRKNWSVWTGSLTDSSSSYVETDSGETYLMHYDDDDYEIYTYQTINNIPNGHYCVQALIKSSGGQNKNYIDAKNYGLNIDHAISPIAFGDDDWTLLELPGILVSNNTLTVGIYSNANGGNWTKIKEFRVIREDEELVYNGAFELDNPNSCWGIWPGNNGIDEDASYFESGGYNSDTRLTHCKAANYEVFTGQTLHNLVNGTYTLSAWVKGSGYQKHFLSIKHYGGTELIRYIPVSDQWTFITIPNIPISSSMCEVGLYSNADAYEWCSIDNISLQKTNTYCLSTQQYSANTNLISNYDFETNGSPSSDGWSEWTGSDQSGVNASFVEQHGYQSSYRLTHYKAANYEVFNGIVFNDLIPGRYTLSAWVMGDGTNTHFISVKNHGRSEEYEIIPAAPYPQWTYIEITDIPIYIGTCEIGYYSNASGNSWSSIDNVQFYLQDE